jgi:hypothetical protein
MKAQKLNFSPFSVKRALAVSAKPLPHLCHYAQGHGLLQVLTAKRELSFAIDSLVASFTIIVVNKTFLSLSVMMRPNKQVFRQGEHFQTITR